MHHHRLSCRCGALQGQLLVTARTRRMVCYCKDCQAFARFLGPAEAVLDAQGGTDVVHVAPHQIRFTAGADRLAVMRLSDKGMLRWYAACCHTAVGNTANSRAFPFVGLVHSCLESQPLEASIGPVLARCNTASALGQPLPRNHGMWRAVLRIATGVLTSLVSGRYKDTPFFAADGRPVARPTVLSPEARARLELPS